MMLNEWATQWMETIVRPRVRPTTYAAKLDQSTDAELRRAADQLGAMLRS